MLKNYNKYKILKIFLENPTEQWRLRQISKECKIAPLSVMNYLKEFEKEDLIKKTIKNKIPLYQSNQDNENFKVYKKISIIYEINESKLIDFLWEKLAPKAIILYGSQAKGESTEQSDIDLFIIGKGKKIDLYQFEKKLKKTIHIIFEEDIKKISNELKNNLINGIVLKGYLKLI